jgi:hypothetical protein
LQHSPLTLQRCPTEPLRIYAAGTPRSRSVFLIMWFRRTCQPLEHLLAPSFVSFIQPETSRYHRGAGTNGKVHVPGAKKMQVAMAELVKLGTRRGHFPSSNYIHRPLRMPDPNPKPLEGVLPTPSRWLSVDRCIGLCKTRSPNAMWRRARLQCVIRAFLMTCSILNRRCYLPVFPE